MNDHGYYDENWDEITRHGQDVWADGPDDYLAELRVYPCGRKNGKGTAMTQQLNLEKALKDLAEQQETVAKLLRQTQRFPNEFPVGTVLKFKHVFMKYGTISVNGVAYDYVALRANNGFWYLTCSGSKTMSWEQLVEFIGDEEVTIMVEGEKI